ncbi:MAG: flavodoxin family protein [Alphaproteobacteria bacterium]|uniref:Flavodoxin family protein n=1 Tax=Candidatus Nitrobium versatile TaxID=2884831 RepID=A0A953M1X3_9BACT|nr:flavodoxin family protein [Candidatus Nitrobium versatile]
MKIAAFQGSPRVEGNSELLLREALRAIDEAGHEIQLFKLNLMKIRPCQDCGGCDQTGVCIIRDEMDEIYKTVREADRIVLASPIFFFGLSAQAKAMIDRCQAFWCEKYLLKRPLPDGPYGRKGLLILVGGMKKEVGIQCSEATARAFFRTVSVPDHETVGFLSVDAKGAILEHPTALRDAYEAGKRLIALP